MGRYLSALAVLCFVATASAQQLANNGQTVNPPMIPGNPSEAVNYQHDDGSIDTSIGLTDTAAGTYDLLWLNRFTVAPGGELIDRISVAYGRPGNPDPTNYNGIPVQILLYNDPDGGSTTNATLVHSQNAVIANANTTTLNNYTVPNVPVNGFFLVGVVAKNVQLNQSFLATEDTTDPDIAGASFIGFTDPGNTMNEANLASIPAGQYGTIESFGATLAGNWFVRAQGQPIPEPASLGLLTAVGVLGLRRRR